MIGSSDPITINGGAPAHSHCHQFELMSQRIFKNIQLTTLSNKELDELNELVLLELNSRNKINDSVDLF